MLQLYYMISVIISNPSITVKCAPCEDSIVMNTKKACENNPFPHAFFVLFLSETMDFPYHLLTIPLQCCWDKCPGYDTVLVKNVMSAYLSAPTVISSEKQLVADRLCTG